MSRPKSVILLWVLLCGAAALPAHAQTFDSLQITNLQRAGEGWMLEWQGAGTGAAYSVQFQDTFEDLIWRSPDSTVPFPLTSNSWSDFSTTNDSRFFRVIAVPAAQRGMLISATLSNTLSTTLLTFLFNAAGVPITPQYNVRLYKIEYETITPLGARTRATGALAVPENAGQTLPLVSYQHDTITQTNAAPSSMSLSGEVTVGAAFATTGYAALVPDYLGLGGSPGFHPYHHARSEATSCIDLLRAARTFCATNGFPLNDKLFLCGYSEGGHATLALLRELEMYHTNEFSVTACAAMAGAYDLSGVTTTNFLTDTNPPNPAYFLYLIAAYQDIYHLAPTLGDLFAAPYNTTLPPLLNGSTTTAQLNQAMPANPAAILIPDYLAALRANPRHPLRLALRENDVFRWRPRAPLRLYHCAADRDVIIANSEVALASFQALGASQVQLFDPIPSADHVGCSQPSLLLAKGWFDSLK